MNVQQVAERMLERWRSAVRETPLEPRRREIGRVLSAGDGIALVSGLAGAQSQELLRFPSGAMALALNLDEESVGCVMLGGQDSVFAGDTVNRTGQVLRMPVGADMLGRMVDPLGRVLDDGPSIEPERLDPIEKPSPAILDRSPVQVPLSTGVKSIDAMIPIGRGQRELIIGDRSTGKTSIAIDTILNQRGGDVICVYVAIGQRAGQVARAFNTLREGGALDYSVVVAADADSPPGLQYIAPYAGCTLAEYFMDKGHDTLIVYDDLSRHARVYRQISLLLRRPPGREAFPGDIFFLHSRLLERAVQLDEEHGGGSQTALPIIETQAQNISAYIPTNLISITDGQVYLNPDLFQSGFLPAVDVGRSVSRVGGKTQIPAMKKIAQQLRLEYTQFTELEQFTKFGTSMDEETRQKLERGRRVRELLKQSAAAPVPLGEQVLLLRVAGSELLTRIPTDRMPEFEERFRETARERHAGLIGEVEGGGQLKEEDVAAVERTAAEVIERYFETSNDQ